MLFTITSKINWSLGAIQCSREYKKFLEGINCSFMQLKQQTSHHNVSLLGVYEFFSTYWYYLFLLTNGTLLVADHIVARKNIQTYIQKTIHRG